MLEKYQAQTDAEKNRVEVVKAALEIAKAAVSSSTAITGIKSGYDLDQVTNKICALADAIQEAIDKK